MLLSALARGRDKMFNYLYKINPFYKFVIVFVLAISLTFTSSAVLNIGVFFVCMLLLITGSDKIISALKFCIPIVFIAAGLFVSGANIGGSRHSGLLLATRVIAFAGFGMVFSLTTPPYDFMRSLQKDAKLPRKFAYGILCAFNLVPYIKNEYNNARLALVVRGVKFGFLSTKPLFSMLVNSIRWSEMLSMAMQSKGFDEK